jgi:hypothetical protein
MNAIGVLVVWADLRWDPKRRKDVGTFRVPLPGVTDHFLPAAFIPFGLFCLGFLLFLSFFWLLLPFPMTFSIGKRWLDLCTVIAHLHEICE